MRFHTKNTLASFTFLLFILFCLIGCKPDSVEVSSKIQIGFTSNLNDVQPHLAQSKQLDEQSVFHLASFLQSREDIEGNIIKAVRDAGYDYLELNTAEIALLTDAEFEQAYDMIRQSGR